MKKIKEVLVVEGKDDTKAINRAVNADTIETRGSAIDEDTLALIEKLADQRGVIIFTDPDFSGEKIRKIVAEAVPNAKHAFLPKKEGRPDKAGGSLGVEHATPDAIRAALDHVYTETDAAPELITHADLMTAGLIGGAGAKQRREQLGELLQIGYVNGKQLEKRLRMFGIQPATFAHAIAQLNAASKEEFHE
ncbi:ribonuclease M5 [Levilactobacillus zymae]|uniref:Ribonuclease M5 n=1 Tax=Levilactobacillus zymae TaxID=267363 RepID=A0ABQ0WVZ0_9LACO|nr:ribonuclease M5 [Levilactobacillus zymae]QFR61449.1 ribonuclease M5 [Levilactobacillus zymae]GEO71672.1 ribonuclease M5 [Levilactobacillus zymae]